MNLQFMKDFLPFEIKEVMGQILSQQSLDFFFGSLAQGIFVAHFPSFESPTRTVDEGLWNFSC